MFRNRLLITMAAFSSFFGWTVGCCAGRLHAQVQAPEPAATARARAISPTPSGSGQGTTVLENLLEAKRLFRKGDFDAAIQKYQEVMQSMPNSPTAYVGMTRAYLKKKDVNLADATIMNALKTADCPAVRVALGEVYFREGKIPEAESEWVKVINSGIRTLAPLWDWRVCGARFPFTRARRI